MELLSTAQAAEKLGVSERRVRQLINEGKLAAHKLGRDFAIEEVRRQFEIKYGSENLTFTLAQ